MQLAQSCKELLLRIGKRQSGSGLMNRRQNGVFTTEINMCCFRFVSKRRTAVLAKICCVVLLSQSFLASYNYSFSYNKVNYN